MATPKFPKYGKDSLRPNPDTADPEAKVPFAQETIRVGHFGDWDASARVVNGLPPEGPARPGDHGQPWSPPVGTPKPRGVKPPRLTKPRRMPT